MKKLNWPLIMILAACAFLYFFQLGAPTAWDQDEGQMFASSLEMVKSGEYLTPHLNGEVYFHKPPLYAWLTAALFRMFGFTEFLGRFWAAAFALMGVCLVHRFAKELYGERAGLLAALILGTSPLYIVLAKMALVDNLLTLMIFSALFFFFLGYRAPAEKKWFYLMYVSMALGVMTKGPLGVVVPSASIFLFLLFERKIGFIREMELLKGIPLFLLVASPWFIVETVREGRYFLEMIFGQFLFSIYMSPMQQHEGPFYYYALVILLGFIPWSALFVPALFKRPDRLMLSLFLIMLGIFSTASTKVPGYFLPAFPAMAVITGAYLDRVFSGENKAGYYFGLIFTPVILAFAIWGTFRVDIPAEFAQALIYLQTLLLVALAGFFLAFLFSFMKPQPRWSIPAWALTIVVFFLGLIQWLLPYAENFKPSHGLALAMKGKEHIAFYRTWLPPSLVFYLNRQQYPMFLKDIRDEAGLNGFLSRKGSAAYLPAEEEKKLRFSRKTLKTKAGYVIIEKRR